MSRLGAFAGPQLAESIGMMPHLLLPLNVFHYRRIGLEKGGARFSTDQTTLSC
jgi:hypothetical protein